MCGRDVIPKVDPIVERSRMVAAGNLWNEFNAYTPVGWDIEPRSVIHFARNGDSTPNLKQGNFKSHPNFVSTETAIEKKVVIIKIGIRGR
ncbi:hypothetical protein HanXRQr2_Chr03g0126921 [Helianthus annuus]|nr:hypothetical protein HanXRQr2_Chr03g0126921 [Helianthus annuus]